MTWEKKMWLDEAEQFLEAIENSRRKTNKIETLKKLGVSFTVHTDSIIVYPYAGRKVTYEYNGERLVRQITKDRFRRASVLNY